jgi:hypothetical protein
VPPGTPDAAMAQTETEKKKKFLHLTFKQCHFKAHRWSCDTGFCLGEFKFECRLYKNHFDNEKR